MTTKISITRALTEIKHLSDIINRSTNQSFVGIAKGKDSKKVSVDSPTTSVADVETRLKGNLQSVLDLITRRDTLKRAVVLSNARTVVTINSKTMTVAEAIEMKTGILFKQTLLSALRMQFVQARGKVDAANQKLLAEIDVAVQAAYANEKGKVDEEQYKAVATPRLNQSELSLIDPNKIEEKIAALETELNGFITEVDFVLSESNARTEIEV